MDKEGSKVKRSREENEKEIGLEAVLLQQALCFYLYTILIWEA
jgi:hypothetical protein